MYIPQAEPRWTTNDEFLFLSSIGTISNLAKQRSKHEMLTRYLDSCELRHDWGHMDRGKVIAYAKKLLIEA